MDDIDQMLAGTDDTNPGSQPNQGDQSIEDGQVTPPSQQSPEEVEFNKLPGSTRDRITTFVSRLREKDAEIERLRTSQQQVNVPPAPVQNPLQTLSNAGVALKEDVQEGINQMRHDFEMNRLESRYTGQNGEPQFNRAEVEDYVKTHPEYQYYNPEDVFRDHMFRSEFTNLKGGTPQTGRSSTLRPTGSGERQQTLSAEDFESTLSSLPIDQQQAYYDANFDKIQNSIGKMNPNQ